LLAHLSPAPHRGFVSPRCRQHAFFFARVPQLLAAAALTVAAAAQDPVEGPRRVPPPTTPPKTITQPDAQQPGATPRVRYQPVQSRYLDLEPFDRYGRRRGWNPLLFSDGTGEYPLLRGGGLLDVYNVNPLKGDRPISGEHLFFVTDVVSTNTFESREKANAPDALEKRTTNFLSFELFHGDTVFRPPTWRVRATGAFDTRDADDIGGGVTQTDFAMQELFAEALLWELDPYFDFASLRVGRQAFASDFRNFIFVDQNDGAQLFGSLCESRIDYQLAFFDLVEKDPESNLSRGTESRDQTFFAANVFLEDMLSMGYEVQLTTQWVHDTQGATIDAYYLGFLGDGRLGKVDFAHALYLMFGDDEQNAFAGRSVSTSAHLAAVEVGIPDSWRRYVFSALYASGDDDPTDGDGNGFDSVFDNPQFAGGQLGFFHRQAIAVDGTLISNANSFYPNLRGKAAAGPNSVNPGLAILHAGVEAELSNYWSVVGNASYLQFADTAVLEATFGQSLSRGIGIDLSVGARYRPFGVDNVVITPVLQALVPTGGLDQLVSDDLLVGFFVNATIVL